jgi:hypothetical protein
VISTYERETTSVDTSKTSGDHQKVGSNLAQTSAERSLTNPSSYTLTKQDQKNINKEAAIIKLRNRAYLQLERITVLTDSVILAAEQIQDHRLSKLENAELTVTDFLVNILITFALDSTLAGKVISTVAAKMLAPVMSSPAVLKSLPEMAVGLRGLGFRRSSTETRTQGLASLIDGTRRSFQNNASQIIEEYYSYSITVFLKSNSSSEQNMVAVAKTGLEALKRPPKLPIQLATDSPAVAIIESVQKYMSILRYTILSELSILEAAVRLEILDIQDVNQLTKADLTEEETVIMNSLLRNRYKRVFEAVIWAKMLGFDTKPPKLAQNESDIEGVSSSMRDYFLKRFIHPETEKSFQEFNPNIINRTKELHKYLTQLGEKLKGIREQSQSKSDGITVVIAPNIAKD